MFDIMNIESYQKDGKWAIKCSPEREFHEKSAPFWITDKMKTFLSGIISINLIPCSVNISIQTYNP
jgi:hypothetical protein